MTVSRLASCTRLLFPAVLLASLGCGEEGGQPKPPMAPKPPTAATPATGAGGATTGPPAPGDAAMAAGSALAGAAANAGDAGGETAWTVSTATSDGKIAEVGGLVFPKPATWVWTTPRMRFRTLQYEVPGTGDGAGAAELVFSLFRGTDGGPTDMNIDRWIGQFSGADGGAPESSTSTEDVGGLKIFRMEVSGGYQAMGQPAPRPGQKQLGAIIQAPGRRVFVRLVGPLETVDQASADFDAMLKGVMPEG